MKPLVNLSSAPFRNRRLFWLAVLLIFAGSSLIGYRTLSVISDLDGQIARLEPEAQKKQDEVKAMRVSGDAVLALTTDQTLSMIAAKDLIHRKGFSWSQLLNEIEQLIPPTVRVRKISVNKVEEQSAGDKSGIVTARTGEETAKTVSLSFDITGRNVAEVLKMMEDFKHTGHFEVYPKSERVLEGTDEVEFDLNVKYRPPVSRRAGLNVPGNQVAEGRR